MNLSNLNPSSMNPHLIVFIIAMVALLVLLPLGIMYARRVFSRHQADARLIGARLERYTSRPGGVPHG